MKIVARIRHLLPQRVRLIVLTAENNQLRNVLDFKLESGVHSDLLKNLNKTLILEVNDGKISKVGSAVPHDEYTDVFIDKFALMGGVLGQNIMKKDKFYIQYSKIVNCSYRTAQRHLRQAINSDYIIELNDNNLKWNDNKDDSLSSSDLENQDTEGNDNMTTKLKAESLQKKEDEERKENENFFETIQ